MIGIIKFVIAFCIGLVFSVLVCFRLCISIILFGKKALSGPKERSRPKILSDNKYGKSGYLHLKNLTMHYVANGDSNKPLLLLLHGFPEFWFSWRHQLNSELANRFWVVAVDMRGYGSSDKPLGVANYKMQLLVEDVRQAIKALGRSSCHLVGHDFGGTVAWTFAMWHPTMVRKLAVLNSPHPSAFSMYIRRHKRQFFKSWYMFFFQLPRFPEWLLCRQDLAALEESLVGRSLGVKRGMISQEELEAFKYAFGSPDAMRGPVDYFRAAVRHSGHASGLPIIVDAPTLLVFGSRDRYVCEDAARLSARFCRDFKMSTVPEASHWVQQDAPDQVNSQLLEFFE